MDFEKLKQQLKENAQQYINQLDAVKLEGNLVMDQQEGRVENIDGYNRLAQLIQVSANDSLRTLYEAIPQQYWDDMDQNEEECEGGCCGGNCSGNCSGGCGHCHHE